MEDKSTQQLNKIKNLFEDLINKLEKDGKISQEDLKEYKDRFDHLSDNDGDRLSDNDGDKLSTEGKKYNLPKKEVKKSITTKPPQFSGFNPAQVSKMLYSPFEPGCPVQIQHLSEQQIEMIPFMRQALWLMNSLDRKDIILTPKGNLPTRMVGELYDLGPHSIFSDFYDRKSEDRIFEVKMLTRVLEGSKLIKRSLGKISLTTEGKTLLSDHNQLLRSILLHLFGEFNLGLTDSYEDREVGNVGKLYSLWLVHHYGGKWRDVPYYAKLYHQAFPDLTESSAYHHRVFVRLFRFMGVCEVTEPRGAYQHEKAHKTPLLDMMFSFEEPANI